VLIQYSTPSTPDGKSCPVNPYKASSPKYTVLASHAHDINPADKDRANIIRDGAWIKEHWTQLKGYLSRVFASFNKSGEQSG
jgi:hypothetical protein